MTLDEAITHAKDIAERQRKTSDEWLKQSNEEGSYEEEISKGCKKCAEEYEQLADWLEELKQYRAIGTLEEVRNAVEKQKAKSPTYEGDGYAPDGSFVWDEWLCPNCGSRFEVDYEDYDYCTNCGQRIDWREEE